MVFIPKKNYPAEARVKLQSLRSRLPKDIADPIITTLDDIFNQFAVAERTNYIALEKNDEAYMAQVYRSGLQTVANTTIDPVVFDETRRDDGGIHDATNQERLILNKVGLWVVSGSVGYAVNGTGSRWAILRKNGVTYRQTALQAIAATYSTVVPLTGVMVISEAVTDYVTMNAFHNSGGNLDVADTESVTWFEARYIGPLITT